MAKKLLIGIALFLTTTTLQAQTAEKIVRRVTTHWLALHNDFKNPADVWGNYTLDLTLEALLFYDHHTNDSLYTRLVIQVLKARGIAPTDTIPYTSQPFCSINYTLGECTSDSNWFIGFISESYRLHQASVTSSEGGIMILHQNQYRLLIDYMQEYASRMAKTGHLTGDTILFAACINQYLIYESLLSDSLTGLWCQGRGWCSDSSLLANGAWSRGQGWLLRGLVTSLLCLPESYQTQLLPVLERLAYSLRKVQAPDGMYHILLNQPAHESAPDVSGTGMTAYYLALAVRQGWLQRDDFEKSILKATKALRNYVGKDGTVYNSSKGPGPLCSEDEYKGYKPEKDEKHGFQGIVYGMLAELLLKK